MIRMSVTRALAWILLSGSLAAQALAEPEAPVQQQFVFESAPFPQCHASTICETPDGTLVAAWFGGTHEKHPDVGIWVARWDGETWSEPREVADGVQYVDGAGAEHRHPCWNPVLFQPREGPLLLFYKCGPNPAAWWGMRMTSNDGGQSWSEAVRLPEGIDGPVKNKPLQLPDGRILCGSSTEHDGWRVHFEITPDAGQTWTRIGPINDGQQIGAIQPSILQHGQGRLQAIGRSRQGRLWQAWSEDGGQSWSEMTLTDLPNPNSGTDAVTLADGRHLLVYNPTKRGRTPLAVAISKDGHAWRDVAILEDEPGEYSYPAVIQARDGRIHVTYTWRRQRIRHAVLDPAAL